MAISIVNNQNVLPINPYKIRRRLGLVLANLQFKGAGLTVLVTDDQEIRVLNRDFRGLDQSTNVLSFSDTNLAKGLTGYLGDIAISSQTILRQSQQEGIDPGELFYFYLIHAVLHLAGHDHELGQAQDQAQQKETERLLALIKCDL
ncbi:MAG: rRNA maturation RNase YbeY [Deltaproteobacteria bacterium]|jgi:probable rRNA maturation factor|nr:rRNA maturation RNase YbeY [Deltaproteobacteria bacterium]